MTHHVVQDAAPLLRTLPEPGCVWAAVLFGRARQVWPARQLGPPRPEQRAPRLDLRREDLVLEVARRQPDFLDELHDPLRLRDIACERLFTRNAQELAFPALDRADHLFHVFDAGVI